MVKFGILDLLNDHSDGLTCRNRRESPNQRLRRALLVPCSIGTVHTRDNRYFISSRLVFTKRQMARVNMDFTQGNLLPRHV